MWPLVLNLQPLGMYGFTSCTRSLAVQTHLTPSYRLLSILDATPIYRIGAPPLVAVKSATVNGRSVSSFSVRPFWDTVGGRKPNSTGNIPRRGSGLSCRLSQTEAGSLTRFTASIIKHLMLHRKGDRTRLSIVQLFHSYFPGLSGLD